MTDPIQNSSVLGNYPNPQLHQPDTRTPVPFIDTQKGKRSLDAIVKRLRAEGILEQDAIFTVDEFVTEAGKLVTYSEDPEEH